MKKDIIYYPDFEKIDLRVGEIKEVSPVEKSKKLLALQVDLGQDYGTVQILSGIAQSYQPEELINKKCIFIVNLAPREMMGMTSNGMLLAVDSDGKPEIVSISPDVLTGSVIR